MDERNGSGGKAMEISVVVEGDVPNDSVYKLSIGFRADGGKYRRDQGSVVEQGGTPEWSPPVACSERNFGKRKVEAGAKDQHRQPHVDDEVKSDDDDFVLADVVKKTKLFRSI
ncbi:hypothetical protein ZWY2020_040890 [Hordeum vulgare]|nr:hypothetical protein ZWY2020_040890 [Hordeum vulgare]